ncbi:MAG: chain length determinant protein tyrosine kinase EpsG [Azoarcus sp.]|jgi:chain length determinant protein tyrosine kinase EpsG|nr:chain length determinant protein tyrosine kinase EpsG [Azoarcus sp.]
MDDASSAQFSDSGDRSIGAILVATGRLSPDDAERILREQKKRKLRFGEAAFALGLVTEADIQFALSHQFRYPYLQRGESRVSETVVAAYNPFSPQVEALRAVRSQLVRRWFDGDNERRALAIVSPDHGEGRSWLAANLAVVFSQLGARTLLIDADLRHPSQHSLFGIDNRSGLSSILGGRATANVVFKIPALHDLSILPSGPVPPNPQELLARPLLGRMLLQLANSFDAIIIDTPAASCFAESVAIAMLAGGALVVSKQDRTRIRSLNELYACLRDAGAVITGGVLNGGGVSRRSARRLPPAPLQEKWWQVRPARLKSGTTPLLPHNEPKAQPAKRTRSRASLERDS